MIKRTGSHEVLHEVVEHNGVLYLAGIAADDILLDMAGQTSDVLNQIDGLLSAHGSSRKHILSALIFITDMSLKPAMNAAWREWFTAAHLPARATLGVKDLGKGILIEIVVTAAVA
jgi:enamine deaminase RidA (YjgF/YER057c/UK114 family)